MKNKIDKLISVISPSWAYRRAADRHNMSVLASVSTAYRTNSGGYAGGHYGRNRSAPGRSTAHEDVAAGWTYGNMIANAMQLYRDDPMCKSVVDVSGTYLGESRPTATTSDPEWNKLATEYFNDFWWPQADARGRPGVDYGEIQALWDTWAWIGGDMAYLLVDGQLMPYEGLQIRTPVGLQPDKNVVNGVRISPTAPHRITHYYICDSARGANGKDNYRRVRQNEVIFAGSRNWRTAMLRSVPDLHGVIDALQKFGATNDNVQRRIEFESMLWTVERKGAIGNMPENRIAALNSTTGTNVETTKADWGMRLKIDGDPEHDFKSFQMENPSSTYVPTMEFMARVISSGTGFPYEVVNHVYTSGSYTANRAARLDFSKALMRRWAWRNKVLNQRVWNWRIAKAMKEGDLPLAPINESTGRSEWHKAAWTLPHFPHIDEGKEVVADIKQWGCGQESIADWAQQKGMTRDQLLDAHDADIEDMQRRADALGIPLDQYMAQLFTAPKVPVTEGGK